MMSVAKIQSVTRCFSAVLFAFLLGAGRAKAGSWSVVESGTTSQLEQVVWHKGRFISYTRPGWNGSIISISSNEGLVWNAFNSGNPVFGTYSLVTAGDALFSVPASASPSQPVSVSFNGTNWVNTDIIETPNDFVFGGGRYVAVGYSGRLWSSLDGIDWQPNTQGVTSDTLNVIQYSGGVFVAAGNSGTTLRSLNGLSWTVERVPFQPRVSGIFSNSWHSVLWNGSRFRAVRDRETYESLDGKNWKFFWDTSSYFRKIVFARGQYLAVSDFGEAWESTDMKFWKKADLNSNAYISDVTYGEGRFVLVGANGLIRVRTLPTIVDQPQSLIVPIGGRIELNSTGVAEGAFGLQWRKDGQNLAGKTSASLVFETAEIKDGGKYSVRLSASGGGDLSQTASVGVVDTGSRTVVGALGKTVTFAIRSGGVVENVEWKFFNGAAMTPVIDGAGLSGGTTKTITIRNLGLNQEGDYSWSVGGVNGGPIRLLVATKKPDYALGEIVLGATIVGGDYDFTIPFPSDLDGAPSAFSATGLPAGVTLDAVTGRLRGKPTAASTDAEGHLVRLTMSNAFGSQTVSVRLKVEPLPVGVVGQFNGIVERGSELGGDSGGRMDMTITKSGGYSGSIRLGSRLIRFKGALMADVTGAELPKGEFTVQLGTQNTPSIIAEFEVDGSANVVRGRVKDGLAQPSLSALRNVWSSMNRADAFGGYYTVALPLDFQNMGSVTVPQGTGFVTVKINAVSGRAQISGRLSDGTAITCSCLTGPSGEVLQYWFGYNTAMSGTVLGTLSMTVGVAPDGSDTLVSGMWTWTRPEDTSAKARVYRKGFGPLTLMPAGSKYVPPARTEVLMGLPVVSANPPGNAVLSFDKTLGDDAVVVDPDISILIKAGGGLVLPVAALNPKKTTLKLSVSTGLFSGSHVTQDDNPRPLPALPRVVERRSLFYGVIVNDGIDVRGVGYFLRPALPSTTLQDTPLTSPVHSRRVWLE